MARRASNSRSVIVRGIPQVTSGLTISRKKIYFDGFLPSSKRETRISRLQNYTKQLNSYYEAWPQVIPSTSASKAVASSSQDLFGYEPVPARLIQIPAAPFLVPAVIEALSQSTIYRDMVEVVPGEADLYCARYLSQHGGIVITGDSDLLVHDIGASGVVTFFRDIQLVSTRGKQSIRGVQYKTAAIAERLELPADSGLRSLGFEMFMDRHASLPQLLQRARKITAIQAHAEMYKDFMVQYTSLPINGTSASSSVEEWREMSEPVRNSLHYLDPRISEFVLQSSLFSEQSQPKTPTSKGEQVDMFLPFMTDCPVKTSAWEMSTPVRQISYGLLNLVSSESEQVRIVMEHRRQQNGSRGREWQVPSIPEMQDACKTLVDLITRVRQSAAKLSNASIWRVLALHQHLAWASTLGKDALCNRLIKNHDKQTVSKARLDWDKIHFVSQLNGSYYSYRILKQTLAVLMSYAGAEARFVTMHRLQYELEILPNLSETETIDETILWLGSAESKEELTIARNLLGIEETAIVDAKTGGKKGKKKRKRDNAVQLAAESNKRPTNIFELLNNNSD